MHFTDMKTAVTRQWQTMTQHNLFRTGADKDAMWSTYLASFPAGTNPIFRTRAEHDCGCCRHFVRTMGDVVAIVDGKLTSIWDITTENAAYQTVANALGELVRNEPVDNIFLHSEAAVGTNQNFEKLPDESVRTWDHFFVRLPNSRVCAGKDIGPKLADSRAIHDVLLRGLTELTLDATDTVLELIGQNALYRGEEHRHAVSAFRLLKAAFSVVPEEGRDTFVWSKAGEVQPSVSRIRNTAIGTLLTDLSEGMDLDGAVRKFEAMVAPANYKRPTALVTPAMVAKAKATVEELGLTSALDRRYAHLTDITINNMLFADRSARKVMAGGAFDDIATAAPTKATRFDKADEIGVETFLTDILPKATSVDMLMENRHTGNLVSLIAPVEPASGALFKWDNRFSWSYNGDFADSIKERVKKAGGAVDGDVCCRLGWFNFDDLDFHMMEPTKYEIYFGTKQYTSPGGGRLDVDMNARGGQTREAVENIFYSTTARMPEGAYDLFVHQYAKREAKDVGFEAEIDFKGTIHRFAYPKPLRQGESVMVAQFRYMKAGGIEIIKSLPTTTSSRKVWGIDTETFHRVNAVMLSPNHWDGHGVGNRHYFFMLNECQNDGTARGFYNEFLRGDLDQHRKVFELVGSRMRTDETVNQLSGLGFSSTQRNHAIIRVKGATNRMLRVTF